MKRLTIILLIGVLFAGSIFAQERTERPERAERQGRGNRQERIHRQDGNSRQRENSSVTTERTTDERRTVRNEGRPHQRRGHTFVHKHNHRRWENTRPGRYNNWSNRRNIPGRGGCGCNCR
ncbi:MAG: hypothetical protein FWD13_01070 [Treponema sp.]|nr:hypothetical protein [Treponema sp.]